MGAVAIPLEDPKLVGTDAEPLVCDCEHEFTRGELDVSREVTINWEGDPADFDLDKFPVTARSECPVCSCCSLEDGEIRPVAENAQQQWLCTGCGRRYDDQDEALDCCG